MANIKSKTVRYLFKLYVLGESETSLRAISNMKQMCEEVLKGDYQLEVVDLMKNMQLAEDQKIFATPLLEKQSPGPMRRIVGDLSDKEKVLFGIGVLPILNSQQKGA